MAEGFGSPQFPLGLASTPSAGAQPGCRSLLAFWLGGACAPTGVTPTQPGCRSLLAFWMGGACAPAGVVVPPAAGSGEGGGWRIRRERRVLGRKEELDTDEEDLAVIIPVMLETLTR